MARPTEQKAEYFPHYVGGGKTLRALERAYGNDGYAFWFKLLETLCATDGHCLDLSNDIELIDLAGRVHKDESEVIEMIDYLVRLGQVDRALWGTDRRVWIQGLIDNLSTLYAKRTGGAPRKPTLRRVSDAETSDQVSFRDGNADDDGKTEQSDAETPQRRVEKSKEEQRRDTYLADDARACDPYDTTLSTSEDQAVRAVVQEFIPCGLGEPNQRIMGEIEDMVILPEYGPDPPSRAALIIRAMGEVAGAPNARRSWGTVKGLIRHWQKHGTTRGPTNTQNDTGFTGNPFEKMLGGDDG